MRMKVECEELAPGVENGKATHARTEFGEADIKDGLTSAAKNNGIEDLGCVKGEGIEEMWDGEHGVEVRHVEQFLAPGFEPVLTGLCAATGAVPVAAGIPGDAFVAALITTIAMTAEGGSLAVGQSAHHRKLARRGFGMLSEIVAPLRANDGAECGLGGHGRG